MSATKDKNKYLRRVGLFALIVAVGACAGVASQQGSSSTNNTPLADDDDPDVFAAEDENVTSIESNLDMDTTGTASVTAATQYMKNVKVGKTKTLTLTFKNKRTDSVVVTTGNTVNSLYTVTDNCTGKTLAKSKTCTIKLVYTPIKASTSTDEISLNLAYSYTGTSDSGTQGGATLVAGCAAGDSSDSGTDSGTCTPNGYKLKVVGTGQDTKYLTGWPTGSGSGSIKIGGKACPTTCKNAVVVSGGDAGGKSVTVVAKASNDSYFAGWSGGGCDSDSGVANEAGSCSVKVLDDTKVSAWFVSTQDAGSSSSSDGG